MARRKNMARRRIILDNTFKLIRKNGVDSVSLQMIAEKSGISKSLLQSYYPHKRGLMTEIMHSIFTVVWEKINNNIVGTEESTFVRINIFIYVLGSLGLADPGLDRILTQAFTNNKTLDYWSKMLNSWINDRNILTGLDKKEINMMHAGISFITTGGGRLYYRRNDFGFNAEIISDIMTTTLMTTFLQFDQGAVNLVLEQAHQIIEDTDLLTVYKAVDGLFDDESNIEGD